MTVVEVQGQGVGKDKLHMFFKSFSIAMLQPYYVSTIRFVCVELENYGTG
jgi:hypothetical protein